jgi:hypothetical protein
MKQEACFRIFGTVRRKGSPVGVPGLQVQAVDKDLFFDDRLGTATTDTDGRFEIRYEAADFMDFFEFRPDIYLTITDTDGAELFTTEDQVRYEADDTEGFLIELPPVNGRIGDTAGLIHRLLDDQALLTELSDTVAGPLLEKGLLADGLTFTLVPRVCARPKALADLFVTALGPQPEPPDKETLSHPVARLPTGLQHRPPWWWWWIGLPPIEFLLWLDDLRLSDIPVQQQSGLPTGESADFALRIMADKALVTALAGKIARLFSRHGLVMEAGKTYVFTPLVYEQPVFAGAAFAPQLIASAAHGFHGVGDWINPIDGIMTPELHRVVHRQG